MNITRRNFMLGVAATGLSSTFPGIVTAAASQGPLPLKVAVRSPWMANQVALTSNNVLFLGLPRYSLEKPTPSRARLENDGSLKPFPNNSWNDWVPGKDGREAFVYLNSVHVFADNTVWCVDQGSLSPGLFPKRYATPQNGAQKLVQLDSGSGKILNILRFDDSILPPGAKMNDLRFHGTTLYISDSGLGGIIVHDLRTGKTLRRLSERKVVKSSPAKIPSILAHIKGNRPFHPPHSDLIEITDDGNWLYWASPTGPFYRVETRFLKDPSLSDDMLADHVEHVYDNNFSGGCCMDSVGNIYFSETTSGNITLLAPTGKTTVLTSSPTLVRPDGLFISSSRHLYIPVKHPVTAGPKDDPFVIYSVALPKVFDGVPLGGAIDGQG